MVSDGRTAHCNAFSNILLLWRLVWQRPPPQASAHLSWLVWPLAWQASCKLTWLVLGGDPAARSHRVEQFTAL